ncbi:putative acetyltransferase [Enterococcus sp. PF1-24]|uniref:GNAT family N-acetyltransferase n=1 Tax=unclassified Enterococcus TaxID=2608891 RepID=UPI0024735634|nr:MULTISPECIES: GNAT family N-acetyltransferase [unclassified Enterococcus]MDH6364122.1 putative acetyltransferase [Enterococcus sp. PFB1-1]MDH6401223.1 putative acetyltransferase [Enterococcus sp. PF1-24]
MQELCLISPSLKYQAELIAFREEFGEKTNGIPGSGNLIAYPAITDWLAAVEKNRNKETLTAGLIPAEQYIAMDSNKIIGILQLRLELNDYLLDFGGHIGYAIRPTERQKGYGTQMLTLALKKAKTKQMNKILITCDDKNLASAKVIEKIGGILEDKRFLEDENIIIRRYWIDL